MWRGEMQFNFFCKLFLQPLLFVFIFGKVMVGSGYMPSFCTKSTLLPGIIAISMTFTGNLGGGDVPLIAEFRVDARDRGSDCWLRFSVPWIAIEKVIAGMLQALVAGLMVIPHLAWLVLRPGVDISIHAPWTFAAVIVLVATFSACGGLALGCSINQQHIGLMFGMVITPMIFFGCTYYPWSALKTFPIMQKIVLINPLVYASEGMRATLAPQFPHLPIAAVVGALCLFDVLLLVVGLRQFGKKAVS